MRKNRLLFLSALAGAASILAAMPAAASLTTFKSFTGNIGYSTDGFGSTTQAGVISASVPFGSTVLGAYLYTSAFGNSTLAGAGVTMNGTAVSFGPAMPQTPSLASLSSARADVTSLVASVVNGGAGGVYNFDLREASESQDGEALVVIYSNAALGIGSFGLLDGFSASAGDSTAVNFAAPLDPTQAGFSAEMVLGIGFSFDGSGCTGTGQSSTVSVNSTVITNSAGCNDDSADVTPSNGNLITVGGYNDSFSSLLPSIANDHERYNLKPYINKGDTSIQINTRNPSGDDNIFMAGFYVTGVAGFNEPPPNPVPEPETYALMLGGLALLGAVARRRRAATST